METAAPTLAAQCTAHPDHLATAVCGRCGAFACASCFDPAGSTTCAACRERTGEDSAFPLSRDRWTFAELLSLTTPGLSRNWVKLSGALVLTLALSFAFTRANSALQGVVTEWRNVQAAFVVSIPVSFAHWTINSCLGLGFVRMAHLSLTGRQVRFTVLFGQFPKVLHVALLLVAISGIALVTLVPLKMAINLVMFASGDEVAAGAFALAGAVPVGWVLLPLYFAHIELALNDQAGVREALVACFRVTRNQRLPIIGVGLLSGFVGSLGALLVCVGLLVTLPLAQMMLIALYLTLRNGSGLPPLQVGQGVALLESPGASAAGQFPRE